jgi:fluoroquinolone transport system permease protein
LAGTLGLTNGLLGIATGFMMIDDKDGKIYELMQVTPLGRKGYLFNRLLLPGVMTLIYSSVIVLTINPLSLLQGIILVIMCIIQSALFAIALFHLADDQVKGLTYAKGLNIIIIFAFTRLIQNDFISIFALITPTYWLTETIQFYTPYTLVIGLMVHLIWLSVFIYSFTHKKS